MRANKRTTSSAESSSTPPTQKVTLQTFIKNRFLSSSSSSTSTSSVNSPLKFAIRAGAGAAVGALIGYAAFNFIDERSSTTSDNVETRILSQRCRNWYMKSTGALFALAVGFDKFIPFQYRAGMIGVGLPLVIYTLKNSNYDIPKNGRVKVLEERRYKLDDEENVELKK